MPVPNVYIKVILAVLWSALLFVAGWRVEYWHFSAQQAEALATQLKQQNENMDKLVAANNKEVDHIDNLNLATSQDQVTTQKLIQDQSNAITKLNSKVASLGVGVCTLSPNADSVLDNAYKIAFPPPAPDATKH